MTSQIERFWNKVQKTKTCWVWTAAKTKGYGNFWFNQKRLLAHRVSYELLKEKIPEGFHIDHLCRNPSCVNPDHLEAVEPRENIMRGIGPSAIHRRKRYCIRKHELNEKNITINGRGARVCLRCAEIIRKENSTLIGPTRSKNHCINGHEYTADNTRINKFGYRICRTCHKKTANMGAHKDRTQCKNGHKFVEQTTYINPRGIIECQICRKNRALLRAEKLKLSKISVMDSLLSITE